MLRPLSGAIALTVLLAAAPEVCAQSPHVDARVAALLDEISEERLAAILQKLESFGTRHTLSVDMTGGRGIGAARQWILEEMRSYGARLEVSLDCYDVAPQGRIAERVELCNVMAVLPGRSARRVYVSGHYDTVARREDGQFDWSRFDNPAPGVNDDGSGTALTMELARVLSQSGLEFDATLVFIALAGEEEGLVGARLHAQAAARDSVRIDAVLNNDIVGNVVGGNGIVDGRTVRVFAEGPEDSPSRALARFVRRWGAAYEPSHEVRLIAREDRFGRGGDHTAFNQLGYAGVRFTESRENYARQHTADDRFDGTSPAYLARNARVNAAAAATLALAPPAPDVAGRGGGPLLDRGESGYDARLRWRPSPGAVGYRIFWREAWGPDWQHELHVGDVTEHVLPDVSIDDYIFGVAAVDANGHESLVAPYVRQPRPFQRIETAR